MPTALITGANRGIGLELCRQLGERGTSVIAACRTPSEALSSTGARVIDGVDVTDDASVERLANAIADPVDLLVNNAGILVQDTLDTLDFETARQQFEVNALGPVRVTRALAPRLHENSKVAIITSLMGSMTDNTSGSMYGYRMSKAAVNSAGVSLARDLAERGVALVLLHPGYVQTEMTGGRGNLTAEESATGLLKAIDALTLETSGTLHHANGSALPW